MEYVYSLVNPGTALHMFHQREDFSNVRHDLVDSKEALQVAAFRLAKDQTFRPHRHIEQPRQISITQEVWVIVSGRVEVSYFDLDDKLLCTVVLAAGDLTMTMRGGHTYQALENDTRIYECKSGPYQGQAYDKVFIDGK